MTCINFLLWCQQTTKTISKYNKDSFGPVCKIWSVNLNYMRDSKPQCCVQQPKATRNPSLKATRNPTNRNKHINEATKQTFATNLSKISCKYTQGMLSNWKNCFNVINIWNYDERLCNLSKFKETVMYTTCTNFLIWCQKTTKTNLKSNKDSFGPVFQF